MPALPSASAMTRPTRVPAPVTRATRPFSSTRSFPSCVGGGCERSYPFVLSLEPFDRNVHHSKPAGTLGRPVPIRSATGDQAEEISERRQTLHVFGGMTRMPDLDSVEPCCDQRLQPLTTSIAGWMRPDRDRSSFMRDRDGILDRQSILRHECASVVAKVARECITKVRHPSARNHSPRDVRSADSATIRLLEHLLHRERHSKCV